MSDVDERYFHVSTIEGFPQGQPRLSKNIMPYALPVLFVIHWLYHRSTNRWFMHKLDQLKMIIEEKISSLQDELDLATDVERIVSIHIADRRDEIRFLQYAIRIVQWVLDGADDNRKQRQRIGVDKMLLESEEIMKFD